jgi:5'-3' exonuclease
MLKLALIDMSVIIYQTYFRNEKAFQARFKDKPEVQEYFVKQLDYLLLQSVQESFQPVLLFDKKSDGKYWRQNFIEDNQEEHTKAWSETTTKKPEDKKYKGGRLAPKAYSDLLGICRKAGEILKDKYVYLEEPGLEADDLCGLVIKYKATETHVDLITVDRDWSGLVDDSKNIRFIDQYPKRRGQILKEADVVKFFQEKLSKELVHPSEAYEFKRVIGEAGDNLPANCRIELIDLIEYCAPVSMGFQSAHDRVKTLIKELENNV